MPLFRRFRLPLLAALLALGVATPAHASSVTIGGGILQVAAGDGERNDLLLTYVGSGTYLVDERGTGVDLGRIGTQCTDDDGDGVVRCPGVSSIVVDAGDGHDVVAFAGTGTAPTTIYDGAGNDVVAGNGGADLFVGGAGDDTFAGGNGSDRFGDAGGDGADTLDGGGGTDTADYAGRWTPLSVVLDGVPGDGAAGERDDVKATVERVYGGSGADRLTGGDGNETLKGGDGDDVLDGRGGADVLEGDGGQDTVDYRSRSVRVVVSADGAAGDGAAGENDNVLGDVDSILGGSGNDDLSGNSWHGRIDGGAGSDTLRAGGGDDTVVGGTGDDVIDAGDGDDRVLAGDGRDDVDGGDDDDRIDGGPGPDELSGGWGSDVVDYSSFSRAVVVDLRSGLAPDGDRIGGMEGAYGGRGSDRLRGDDDNGRWDGGPGNDVIDGRGGSDWIAGGSGFDRIDYSARRGDTTVYLGDGANDGSWGERDDVRGDVEHVTTGSGDDRFGGDGDREVAQLGSGNDTAWGNGGDDTIEGGEGRDALWPGSGHDVVRAGGGDDRVGGNAGNDWIDGGPGRDRVSGEDGDDTVVGGDQDDNVSGGHGSDVLDAGHGNDEVYGGTGDDRIGGGPGNDRGGGEDGNDVLDGSWGSDRLDGGRGYDHVAGGPDPDRVFGGEHNDVVDGGDGDDQAGGGSGDDTVVGGHGDDDVWTDDGYDRGDGGPGNDKVDGHRGDDTLTGGDGDDRVNGGDGGDVLDAGPGNDRLGGGSGGDILGGGPGNDKAWGDGGDDRIDGGDGDDELGGGNDNDVLVAGPGADEMKGDGGEDTVDYGGRIEPLRITNDGKADDGARGEGDNVATSVDHFIGGAGDDLIRSRNGWPHRMWGEGGNDTLDGGPKGDDLVGGPGNDQLIGRDGKDTFDGGTGSDRLSGSDGAAEVLRCGAGRDTAVRDRADKAISCERLRRGSGAASDPGDDDVVPITSSPGRRVGTKRVYRGGRFVSIPGSPGERIDRRLLKDIAYLKSKYKVAITDGYARSGHAKGGEHPRGLAVDLVPGPGGSWSDIDRLARWAEPRQGRPRAPFRWVGYNGDAGHGRGHHLHLSWRHSGTKAGRPARWVEVLSFRSGRPTVRVTNLTPLSGRSNRRLGGAPSVRTGLRSLPRCRGAGQLLGTWKAAGRAFKINWKILAAITEIESGYGCNMGPSSAGALGWTQFMPATWKIWGMDADGNGKASPYSSADAIFSSARYLRASGAPRNYRKALFAYNHATWYVNDVLKRSKKFR